MVGEQRLVLGKAQVVHLLYSQRSRICLLLFSLLYKISNQLTIQYTSDVLEHKWRASEPKDYTIFI